MGTMRCAGLLAALLLGVSFALGACDSTDVIPPYDVGGDGALTQGAPKSNCPKEPLVMIEAVYALYEKDHRVALEDVTCWTRATHALIASRHLDYDPVVQGQDYALSNVRITEVKKGMVRAQFRNIRTPMEVSWKLTYKDRWRVEDLLFKGNSMVTLLRASPSSLERSAD